MGNTQKNNKNYDHFLSFGIVGDAMVGKTSALSKFINNTASEADKSYTCTINAEFHIKTLKVNNKTTVKLKIWDFAGNEKYRAIDWPPGCKNVNGYLLFYDLTNIDSFEHIAAWNHKINENSTGNTSLIKILVGAKSDLYRNRSVLYQQGQQLANELELSSFMETTLYPDDEILTREIVTAYLRLNRNMLLPKESIYNIPALVVSVCVSYVHNTQSVSDVFEAMIELALQ
eukprot:49137_1